MDISQKRIFCHLVHLNEVTFSNNFRNIDGHIRATKYYFRKGKNKFHNFPHFFRLMTPIHAFSLKIYQIIGHIPTNLDFKTIFLMLDLYSIYALSELQLSDQNLGK